MLLLTSRDRRRNRYEAPIDIELARSSKYKERKWPVDSGTRIPLGRPENCINEQSSEYLHLEVVRSAQRSVEDTAAPTFSRPGDRFHVLRNRAGQQKFRIRRDLWILVKLRRS